MSIGSVSAIGAASLTGVAGQSMRSPLSSDWPTNILANQPSAGPAGTGAGVASQSQVREKFDAFVGQSFYGQLLHEMHKTVAKTPYFNGGQAEEAFQGQLDQVLSEKMSQANASQFTGKMFDLFNAQMQAANRR